MLILWSVFSEAPLQPPANDQTPSLCLARGIENRRDPGPGAEPPPAISQHPEAPFFQTKIGDSSSPQCEALLMRFRLLCLFEAVVHICHALAIPTTPNGLSICIPVPNQYKSGPENRLEILLEICADTSPPKQTCRCQQ